MSGPAEIPVLDKGFVRLVDAMGDDMAVVQAARVSYGSVSKGQEQDKKLLFYLLRHKHMTPFEQAVFKFHVKCPIFVMRQWIRHRTGAFNEASARYREMKDDFYVPQSFRGQDVKNKQGSVAAPAIDQAKARALLEGAQEAAYRSYQELIAAGVARELARMVLPVNLYTEFYWTVSARNLLHFIDLRADAPAQWEIQRYAEALAGLLKARLPWTWEAFIRYDWKGVNPSFDDEKRRLEASVPA